MNLVGYFLSFINAAKSVRHQQIKHLILIFILGLFRARASSSAYSCQEEDNVDYFFFSCHFMLFLSHTKELNHNYLFSTSNSNFINSILLFLSVVGALPKHRYNAASISKYQLLCIFTIFKPLFFEDWLVNRNANI